VRKPLGKPKQYRCADCALNEVTSEVGVLPPRRDKVKKVPKKEKEKKLVPVGPPPVAEVEALAAGMEVGMRVAVCTGELGEIAFLGVVDGKEGEWVGVRLDAPLGRNNGSVAGKTYFEASPNCGLFVRSEEIVAKDTPEAQPFDMFSCSHAFVGTIMCNRFKYYISMDSAFYWGQTYDSQQFERWLFVRSSDGNSYHIIRPWRDDSGEVVDPTPVMWAAHLREGKRHKYWTRSHGVTGPECNWRIERLDNGNIGLWNLGSEGYLSVRDREGKTFVNAEKIGEWEEFSIEVECVSPLLKLESLGLKYFEAYSVPSKKFLSYQISFKATIESNRFKKKFGVFEGTVGLGINKDLKWEFIPHPNGNAYFIQNVATKLFWNAEKKQSVFLRVALKLSSERDDISSAFYLERHPEGFYAFRSVLSDQYLSAEIGQCVLEKDEILPWEYFKLQLIK
jgi:hypothetical protein